MSKEIFRGSSIVALLTLASRLTGMVWNLVMAAVFGAGALTDLFFVAFRIPNILRSFLAEGALTSAFVPVFAGELHKSREQADSTLRSVIGLLLFASVGVTILGIIFTPLIIQITAPGFAANPGNYALCVELTRITFPYIIFVSIIAVINGALNNLKIFGASPAAQITMNLVMIAASLLAALFEPLTGIIVLAWSVIAGGIVQILVQQPRLKSAGLNILPKRPLITPTTKRIFKLMLPAIFGSAVYQISIFFNTILASLLEPGSISWLFYADRIAQIPVGLITISVASVLLPSLAGARASADNQRFSKELENSGRFISFLLIPAAILIFLLAEPVVTLFLQHGSFTARDAIKTTQAIQFMSIGLWGISIYTVLNRAFLANHDTKTPMYFGLISLLVNLIICLLLMGEIPGDNHNPVGVFFSAAQSFIHNLLPLPAIGHNALALASGLSMTIMVPASLYLIERRRLASVGRQLVTATFQAIAAGTVMVIVAVGTQKLISNSALQIVAVIITGLTAYVFSAYIIKSREAAQLIVLIKDFSAKRKP